MRRDFKNNPKLKFIIGDVRDKYRLLMATKGIDFVFHLAALKHVPICEENPWEAVQTNIIGTQYLIDVCIENNIQKVVDVSTDKAVDPLNLYGVTKACGEKLIVAANKINYKTEFVCIRGGNVIGTNGSVVPLFKEQLIRLNEITITHDGMTRFLMRLEEAIQLVLEATINSVGGEIFVMKMPACRISDLANVMIKRLGNNKSKKKIIGVRPGEKMYEVLVSRYELSRTYTYDKYFVILPQIKISNNEKFYTLKGLTKYSGDEEFNSNNAYLLSQKEIEEVLEKDGWLNRDTERQPLDYLRSLDEKTLENFFKAEGWIKNSNSQ
jgi:FlaA1/EpsC-like NDP-sugar epimerase